MTTVEDVVIGISIFVGTGVILSFILWSMRRSNFGFFDRHNHVIQLLLALTFIGGFVVSVSFAFGTTMATSLLTGIGISLGLALQPIMTEMVAGVVFDTTVMCNETIEVGDYSGRVHKVGMVHTWITDDDGNKVCIHNDFFNKNPVRIIASSVESGSSDKTVKSGSLMYW